MLPKSTNMQASNQRMLRQPGMLNEHRHQKNPAGPLPDMQKARPGMLKKRRMF